VPSPSREPFAAYRTPTGLDAAYYEGLHFNEPLYAQNNWLLGHEGIILRASPSSLLEIGCGNGKFLRSMAGRVPRVIGIDWALSPALADFPATEPLIKKLCRASRWQYHVIACYDDGHSHLLVFDPETWRAAFRSVSPDFDLVDTFHRRDDPNQVVCVITNIEN
jgi:SAM-dependent methyltransferase